MRKSTIFISTALTTFMLVMLFGVVSAYQKVGAISQQQPVSQQQSASQQQPVSNVASVQQQLVVPAQTTATMLTAEQAAQVAAQAIGRTDLYSVETKALNGLEAYLVTFSSGDLVYVSPAGQILQITKLQPVVVVQRGGGGGGGGGGSSQTVNTNNGGSHESGDHEGGGGGDD